MVRFRLVLGLGAITACCIGAGFQNSLRIWQGEFGPVDDVRVSNPKLIWNVWVTGGGKITASSMTIGGKPLKSKYDERRQELSGEIVQPLPPGTYDISCSVTIDGKHNIPKKWKVKVTKDAAAAPVKPPIDAVEALAELNAIRKAHGLPAVQFDGSLQMAASAHTDYLLKNKASGHDESPSRPGYVGSGPGDRAKTFGSMGIQWEVVTTDRATVPEAVHALWDSTYHRIMMMRSGPVGVGASFKNGTLTVLGQSFEGGGVFVSPADGDTKVLTSIENHESPNPTRMFRVANATIGYPIVFLVGEDSARVTLVDSKLTNKAGKNVERYELSSANDEFLTNAAILIPKKPLEPKTQYSVSVKVKDAKGNMISKAWKFTTR